MANVPEHYENLLAGHYSWIYGGIDLQLEKNFEFFKTHNLYPAENSYAVDLGAGSGFQSIPLARLGFKITAIDISDKLLNELIENSGGLEINIVKDNLLNFSEHLMQRPALVVCMGDTLTHLETKSNVEDLFNKVYEHLENNGNFALTFRDLTFELKGTDRFIPVRSDENKVFTCFLEYESEYVIVHDLVYERINSSWVLHKSFYRKCRIGFDWCKEKLLNKGFKIKFSNLENGVVTIIAVKEDKE